MAARMELRSGGRRRWCSNARRSRRHCLTPTAPAGAGARPVHERPPMGGLVRNGHDHGAALARDRGWTPVYLRYNSGLQRAPSTAMRWRSSAAAGGSTHSRCSALATSSATAWAAGGAAGARQHAAALRLAWQWNGSATWSSSARRTPARRWSGRAMGAPRARRHAMPRRSRGSTAPRAQRRHHRSAPRPRARRRLGRPRPLRGAAATACQPSLPLPAGVRCFALAASLAHRGRHDQEKLLGDGLVPLDSALGRHADPARALGLRARSTMDRLRHEPPRPARPRRGVRATKTWLS